jgi:hypothetical protein
MIIYDTNSCNKGGKSADDWNESRQHNGFPAIFFIKPLSFDEIFFLQKPRVHLERRWPHLYI